MTAHAWAAATKPLLECFDALLLDLDGVVYLGDEAIGCAVDALEQVHAAGRSVIYVTNNAAHTPADVTARLTGFGIAAAETEVVTSSMAAADLLASELPASSPVLVVGGRGLWTAVEAAGLKPSRTADGVAAVVQGWGPDVAWPDLAEVTVALRAGARWVATNLDRTLPSPRGPLPGSGSLVAAVQTATGRSPDAVAGKPFAPLYDAARRRSGDVSALMVGDRLDTDITGGVAADIPTLLVLTGVSTAADLLAAGPDARPTYVGRDLRSLTVRHPEVDPDGTVHREADDHDDGLDALRSAAARAWSGALPADQYDEAVRTLDLD